MEQGLESVLHILNCFTILFYFNKNYIFFKKSILFYIPFPVSLIPLFLLPLPSSHLTPHSLLQEGKA